MIITCILLQKHLICQKNILLTCFSTSLHNMFCWNQMMQVYQKLTTSWLVFDLFFINLSDCATRDPINPTRKQFDFKVIYCLIFRTLNLNGLFPNSAFDCGGCGNDHKYQFIKCIVGEYISMWAAQHSKDVTLDQYKSIFRNKLKRMIICSGQ